ncbi:choice-of-anchor Q domain-containing protein [Tahibacter amnicola]|uniref:Outer membrane repeat protein n=1 Tax=Tahibacter amnicola TaxID=2976241 RepID=A0ABY6BGX7_9GAMM|nr:choice-of-anchor Q domain-containing protein [Tahibacter amnicola]UXI69032.1 hypothetical protein N4264_05090 [Tahibacter amnicola]
MHQSNTRREAGAALLRAAILAGLGIIALPAAAATYTVTTLADNGAGSLRDAVEQANRSPGADTITFQSALTGTLTLTSGEIVIFDDLTVTGPGASRLTLSGNQASRVFAIDAPAMAATAITVSLSGLSFVDGKSLDEGGAILVADANLSLNASEFRNNNALRGGAVHAFPSDAATTIAVSQCVFTNNSAIEDGGALGAQDVEGVTISNSRFSNNQAAHHGGAAYLRAVTMEIAGSRFDTNQGATSPSGVGGSAGGGAVRLIGAKLTAVTTITSSVFSNNTTANGAGGALSMNVGTAMLDKVQATGNSAGLTGGAISAYAIALGVTNSTLAGNTATGSGGGIDFVISGGLTLTNATISGNTSTSGNGGGIQSGSGTTLALTAATVVGNTASTGGGVSRQGTAATVRNSIVANNNAPSGPDLSGAFTPNASLIRNGSGATLSAGNGNLPAGTDPLLGPLAVNGGPTLSMMPGTSSPVLNAGDTTTSGLPGTDQRGLARIAGGRIDIGAVERQSPEDVIFRGVFQSP